MMIFVMLGAVLLSVFHQHDAQDIDGLEQACDICLALEHVEVGTLPIALAWVAIISVSIHGLLLAPIALFAHASFSSVQPRAPPLV